MNKQKKQGYMIEFKYYFFLLGLLVLLSACQRERQKDYITFTGRTMGTAYHVKCKTAYDPEVLQSRVDSLLLSFNNEVSTYVPGSTISRFNQSSGVFSVSLSGNDHFVRNIKEALKYYQLTDGYFDATIMPMVNYWGFGYEERNREALIDSTVVDSLHELVGMTKVRIKETDDSLIIYKANEGMKLDFSASAKGDGVDQVFYMIEKITSSHHLMVEIGGELRVKGRNPKGEYWTLGINTPDKEASPTDIYRKVKLRDQAMATSGNYRNYYEKDGITYSHTINPMTGYMERNSLLSATVIAPTCREADALATACMSMGVERAKDLATSWENTAIFLIYVEQDRLRTYATADFQTILNESNDVPTPE